MSRKITTTVIVVLVLAALLAGCGSRPSGVFGIVVFVGGLTPVSPSPLPAGFISKPVGYPYRSVVIEVRAASGTRAGEVVAKVKPDKQALFTIDLPPGDYVLTPLVPKDGPYTEASNVTVHPGELSRTIVYLAGK